MQQRQEGRPGQKVGAFYEDLERLLKEQISKQPELMDVRLKLAELYYETQQADQFVRQARQMRSYVKDPNKSEEWRQVASMGRMLAPDADIFRESSGDSIAFIVPKMAAQAQSYKRIADEERFKAPLQRVAEAYEEIRKDRRFMAELDMELIQSAGHPSSLQPLLRLTKRLGGARVYIKREDLAPRYTHIHAAVLGQALLARNMGKKVVVASTRNGHSGVLVASIAARLGLEAVIYMDAQQMSLQKSHVFRMWLTGAQVIEADMKRHKTNDVRRAALDHWGSNERESFLIMGLDAAPHPYPMMTMEFASVIGRECRRQLHSQEKRMLDLLVARAGENSDAIGAFPPFLQAPNTRLVCVETSDSLHDATSAPNVKKEGFDSIGNLLSLDEQHRATQILEGMEYPRVTREQAWLKSSGRVEYVKTTAASARKAIKDMAEQEGIVPAIQTSYAMAWAFQAASRMQPEQSVVIMMSETVEKNLWDIGRAMGVPL